MEFLTASAQGIHTLSENKNYSFLDFLELSYYNHDNSLMSASLTSPAESVRTRLESISMRLDAATDNLLQTRDLIIRNLEHQMLQLQEVRSALHDAATEADQWAKQVDEAPVSVTPPLKPAVKPMGELTLESLFAPLNAVPRVTQEPPASEPVIEEVPFVSAEVIFENEPASAWQPIGESATVSSDDAPTIAAVEVKPATISTARNEIDPALEKATLDELNEALTRAFAQIANRNAAN